MASLPSEERTRAEALVSSLSTRLNAHKLWDALTVIVPPVLALIVMIFLLVQSASLKLVAAAGLTILIFGFAALGVIFYYRTRKAKLAESAELIDQRASANEHFLTLATIDRANCPPALLARLQREADRLSSRVELKRDFPYTVKPKTYWSTALSVMMILLLYFLLPAAGVAPSPPALRLRELAEKMAEMPRLKNMAERLSAVATKLENKEIPEQERLAAVKEVEKKIAEQQKAQNDEKDQSLLSRAAGELKQAEQQLSASGQQQSSRSQGAGNHEGNKSEQGEGNTKQNQDSPGDDQGKMSGHTTKEMPQGKPSQQNPNEPGRGPGQDKNAPPQQGAAKGDQPDPNRPEKDSTKEKTGQAKGGREGSGKSQSAEEPLQIGSPAERFYKAGEGKEEIKNARYVTVQLPEEIAAETKGESKVTKPGNGGRGRAQVPVSNVPLPPHLPNAPTEKQPMPLEYRGIIK
jgi:hypothetical protein